VSLENIFEAYKINLEKNFAEAVFDLHDEMSERIFRDHKDINGNNTKPYDTKLMYASKEAYKGVRLGGENTKGGKSKKFEGGYAQLKQQSGRPPIMLFGNLERSFNNGARTFSGAVKKVNDLEYHIVLPKEDNDKVKGNFKNFFKVSKQEKANLLKRIDGDSKSNK
jgi:hypothetical protein